MMPGFDRRREDKHNTGIAILLAVLLLVFGLLMVFLIPPGAGYDEEDHLVRVWELSALSFIPGSLPPDELNYPIVFRDFAYRQQSSSGTISQDFWQRYTRASLYEFGTVRREIDTKSVYSPVLLLPQAIAMGLFGRQADLPALPVFYLCRAASLFSYLLLVWLSIRLIPWGKWLLLVLALAPMALFQAATVSPDAVSNGIGFLFIAGSLRIAEARQLGWKEAGSLALLASILFLAKVNLIPLILLPFLLISPSKFSKPRLYFALLIVILALFLLEVAGWNLIAAARSSPLLANEANPTAQLLYILSYPLSFSVTVLKDSVTNGWMYLQGWINGYGYYYWTPPLVVTILYILALGSALLADPTRHKVNPKHRAAFILVFITGYLATVTLLYSTFTPVSSEQIFGVQGRYFIPLVLMVFLAVPGISWAGKITQPSLKWIKVFLPLALALNVIGIALAFHVPCGTTYYQTGLCYQPLTRDFGGTSLSPAVSSEISLTQEFMVACDGLAEIRVLLGPLSGNDRLTTHFRVQDAFTGRILFDGSIENSAVHAEDWYPVSFAPDWDSSGKQYALEIEGIDTPGGRGIQVLYTTQPEFDLGNLLENGRRLQEDMVLQYGCATGLKKAWLLGKP